MEVFVVILENKFPIAIYDEYNKARKYVDGYPAQHLYIYKYIMNDIGTEKKMLDNYFSHSLF